MDRRSSAAIGLTPDVATEAKLTGKPMNRDPSLIDALFARYGVSGPWEPLPSTGVANCVFATRDVVLRVATDHRDAVPDARTESVAAPIAYAAGILTPRLIAFDDTRVLVDRPFSLWERVHGQTLGLVNPPPEQRAKIWRAVGRELAHLHLRVRECPDPRGWLDRPIREQDLGTLLEQLVKSRRVDDHSAQSVERLIDKLRPHLMEGVETRFIHWDVHAMNVMCTPGGELLAIIDWGDAGWGDPAMDFGAIPLDEVSSVLEAYEEEAPGALGAFPEARIAWDRLFNIMDDLWDAPERALDVEALQEFVHAGMG
jgi:aminoglycoside phosphotransferase (APT) family kinase protein